MNALGLVGDHAPLRAAYDGITYFGCKKSAQIEMNNGEEGETGGAFVGQKGETKKQVVNDFVIPAVKPEEKEKH